MTMKTQSNGSELKERARKLGLKVIVNNWESYADEPWLPPLLQDEENERDRRSLERRLKEAHVGNFKPMSEFDWAWPKIDRDHVEDLLTLEFLKEKANVVLVGTNGVGKTMIAQNIASIALSRGHSVRFVKASKMLAELVECDGASLRERRLKKYCAPDLLVVDEVGYMNYDNRYADLLYEVINGRYQSNACTVVTTNKGFKQWGEIFPNAACVVTMVDRLLHKAETVLIEGQSYRQREALERAAAKEKERQARRVKSKKEASKNKEEK